MDTSVFQATSAVSCLPASEASFVTGLPPQAIGSPRYAQAEDRAIWSSGWVCIGTVHAIAEAGDILPYTVGNQGIHVEHLGGGRLVARFNKAPHGGCRLVPLQCQTGTKTKCTFTSCGYSRDRTVMKAGDEVATHQYLGLRPERLLQIPVEIRASLIFVNLGAEAPLPPVAGWLNGDFVNEVWGEYAENWKEFPTRLFGTAAAEVSGGWLTAELEEDGESLTLQWLFPNLVLLRVRAAACAVVLQPTALRQTMARISGFGAQHDWHGMVRRLLHRKMDPSADAAQFLRSMVNARMEEVET